jgi:hypothetical protein
MDAQSFAQKLRARSMVLLMGAIPLAAFVLCQGLIDSETPAPNSELSKVQAAVSRINNGSVSLDRLVVKAPEAPATKKAHPALPSIKDGQARTRSLEEKLEAILKTRRSKHSVLNTLPNLDKDGRWSFSGKNGEAGYHASFDESGLNFEVRRDTDGARPAHIRYKFAGVAVGNQEKLFRNPYPKVRVDAESIEFDHGAGVVERYMNVDGGIEQFYILNKPLSEGPDDLLLMASLNASATKKRKVTNSQTGLKFYDRDAGILLSMSELIVIDNAGRKTTGTMSYEHDTVHYKVSGEWLANAEYPVIIDPIVNGTVLASAAVPFRETFEAPLGNFWCTNSTAAGQARRVTTSGPYEGGQHFLMDSSTAGVRSLNELILAVDLSGQANASLFFFHKTTGDEADPLISQFIGSLEGDGVSISEDGNTWFLVTDLSTGILSTYQPFKVDLAAQAAANNINVNGSFLIKFQQTDNFPTPSDGFFFDEVIVSNGATPAVVVFDEAPGRDFGTVIVGESAARTYVLRNIGSGTANGTISSSSPEFVVTTNGGGYSLAAGATLNVTVTFSPTNAGDRTTNLMASVTGQTTAVRPLTGLGQPIIPVKLPFFDGFESGSINAAMILRSTANGRILIGNIAGPNTGTNQLAMDCSPSGTVSINEAILAVDLTGETTASLSFFSKDTGDENDILPTTFTGTVVGDGVSISGDGTNWTRIVDLTEPNISGTHTQFTVDLIAAAGNAGIALNNSFRIKFQQTDNFPTASDGIFFDDIAIMNGQTAANVVFDPLPIGDFGTQFINASADRTFILRNIGNDSASGSISVNGAPFSIVSGGGNYTLNAGEAVSVNVRFTSATTNTFNDTLTATVSGGASGTIPLSGITIIPPVVSIDQVPSPDFGSVVVGNNMDLTFIVRNTGGSDATGIISLTNNLDYVIIVGGGSYTIAPGSSQMVTVRFMPTNLGRRADILTAQVDNIPDVSTTLVGTGITPAGIISWAVTPSNDYGTVGVGSNSDKTFVLQNTGAVPASGMISLNNNSYSFVSGGGNYSIAPGSTRNVVVRFQPTQGGTMTASLTASLINNGDVINALTGVAQAAPALLWDLAAGGDFGSVATGTSKDLSFTLRNNGNTTIAGTVSVNNAIFTLVSGGGAYSLPAGATQTVVARFSPSAIGPQNATLNASIGAVSGAAKGITGSGMNATAVAFDAAPDGNFGAVTVGGNISRNFVLRNSANSAVSGTITVSNTPTFQVIQGSGAFNIAPNSSQSVVVRFNASILGAQTATLTATIDNGTASSVALTGTGNPELAATLPFSEGFESGQLRGFWRTNSTNEGRIRITSDLGPNLGDKHIVMDDLVANTSQSLNELILTVDLENQPNPTLTFHHKEFFDSDQPLPGTFQNSFNGDGVAISVDGVTWFGLANITNVNSQQIYNRISLDLAQAAGFYGINLTSNFKIKFQQFEAGPAPLDGFAFDDIAVSNGAPTALLTFFNNFPKNTTQVQTARGRRNDVVMNFVVEGSFFEDLRIDSMTFSSSGTGHEVFDIDAVRLVQDNNKDGIFDPNVDTQLGVDQIFISDEGTVTFSNLNTVIPGGTSINLLLLFDIAANASAPVTFTPSIASATDVVVIGVTTGQSATVTPVPFTGPVVNSNAVFNFPSLTRPASSTGGSGGCELATGEPAGPESMIFLVMALLGLCALGRRS